MRNSYAACFREHFLGLFVANMSLFLHSSPQNVRFSNVVQNLTFVHISFANECRGAGLLPSARGRVAGPPSAAVGAA